MIYDLDSKGVHTILQNSFCVGLFENHIKETSDILFNKIPNIVELIKQHRKISNTTMYFIRDDGSCVCKRYKSLCENSKEDNMVLIPVKWENSKSAGIDSIKQMLEHCDLSICLFDGRNKIENIYMSLVDPFTTVNYIIYTGPN